MAFTISYFVICSIAYIMATLFKNFSMGFWIAFTVHAVWIGFEGFGPLVSEWQALVLYYIAASAWAVLGFSFAKLWHHPPLLNGTYLSHTFYGFASKPKPNADHEGITRISSKMLGWLAWMVGAHIVFSLDVPNFPHPWPGIVAGIAIAIGYGVLYWFLADEDHIFKSDERNRRNEVLSYVIWFGAKHLLFGILYYVLQLTLSTTTFYTDLWNFWITIIVWGVCMLIAFITSAAARKAKLSEAHSGAYTKMKSEEL